MPLTHQELRQRAADSHAKAAADTKALLEAASLLLILFAATPDLFTVGLILGVAASLLLIMLAGRFPDERLRRAIILLAVLLSLLAMLWVLMWGSANSLPSSIQPAILIMLFLGALPLAFFWRPTAPRGSLALLSALVLAPLLALGLMVDGEGWETYTVKTQPFLTWRMLSQWLAPRALIIILAAGYAATGIR